jgi:hypothetical protein
VHDGHIRDVRIALGGTATKPWLSRQKAVDWAARRDAFCAATDAALAADAPRAHNAFKISLAETDARVCADTRRSDAVIEYQIDRLDGPAKSDRFGAVFGRMDDARLVNGVLVQSMIASGTIVAMDTAAARCARHSVTSQRA